MQPEGIPLDPAYARETITDPGVAPRTRRQELGRASWGLEARACNTAGFFLAPLLALSLFGKRFFLLCSSPIQLPQFSSSHTFCFSHLETDSLVSFPKSWGRTLIWCVLSQGPHRSTAAHAVVVLHGRGSSCVTGLITWEVPGEVLRGGAGNSRKSQGTCTREKIWTKHKIIMEAENLPLRGNKLTSLSIFLYYIFSKF